MAEIVLNPQAINIPGVVADVEALTDTDEYLVPNAGRLFVVVSNTGLAAADLTIVTAGTIDGLAIEDRVLSIPAESTQYIGPFPAFPYNDVNNRIKFTTASSDLEMSVLRI